MDQLDSESAVTSALPRLTESHYLDLKREPWPAKANDEAEKDLGSFAFDGGFLLVGIDEDTGLTPFKLRGFAERVAQIAEQLSPVLKVTVRTVPTSGTDDTGFAVIEIPPSPARLHETRTRRTYMRHDTVVRAARPEDVEAVRDLKSETAERLDQLLAEAVASFTIGEISLSVAALPMTTRDDLLVDQVQRAPEAAMLQGFACATLMNVGQLTRLAAEQFPDGVKRSLSVLPLPIHPEVRPYKGGVRVSVLDSQPSVAAWMGADGSMWVGIEDISYAMQYLEPPQEVAVVLDGLPVLLGRQLVELVSTVTREVDYSGPWLMGLAVTDHEVGEHWPFAIQPAVGYIPERRHPVGHASRNVSYSASTAVSTFVVHEDRERIVEKLVGRFLHDLGVRNHWARFLET